MNAKLVEQHAEAREIAQRAEEYAREQVAKECGEFWGARGLAELFTRKLTSAYIAGYSHCCRDVAQAAARIARGAA